jgi:hypothetical protein
MISVNTIGGDSFQTNDLKRSKIDLD